MVTFLIWTAIFVTHLAASLAIGEPQVMPALNADWAAMVMYAVTGLLGFWLVIEGFKFVDASIGSLVGLLEIVFGVLFGALFFHERTTWFVVVGGAIIIFAAMLPDLVNIIKDKRTKRLIEPVREL